MYSPCITSSESLLISYKRIASHSSICDANVHGSLSSSTHFIVNTYKKKKINWINPQKKFLSKIYRTQFWCFNWIFRSIKTWQYNHQALWQKHCISINEYLWGRVLSLSKALKHKICWRSSLDIISLKLNYTEWVFPRIESELLNWKQQKEKKISKHFNMKLSIIYKLLASRVWCVPLSQKKILPMKLLIWTI